MHTTRPRPPGPSRRQILQSALASTLPLATTIGPAHAAVALKTLQIVVPAPPASQPDLIARWLVEPLARRVGVPGQVLNRPGAAGAIAVDAVLAAAPDSGSLLLGGLDHVAYSHLNSQRRPLDPLQDFAPVGAVNRDSWLLATGADLPLRDVAALVAMAQQQGPLNYASTGEGSTAHLLAARLCKRLGIEAQHVPYKDPWMPDLIGGRIHFVVAPVPVLVGPLRSGRVRALAALTDARLPMLDAVPSAQELGWPDQVFHGGLFLFAPPALADQAVQLNGWLAETLVQADIVQRYRDASIEPTPLTLAQTRAAIQQRLQVVDAMRLAVFGRTR